MITMGKAKVWSLILSLGSSSFFVNTGQGRPLGVVVYQYTLKKFAKIPKIHPDIPKIIPRYTLYLKFKESDIPNTRIYAAIYRIPNLKSLRIPYTQKPWPTLTGAITFTVLLFERTSTPKIQKQSKRRL